MPRATMIDRLEQTIREVRATLADPAPTRQGDGRIAEALLMLNQLEREIVTLKEKMQGARQELRNLTAHAGMLVDRLTNEVG